MTVPILTQFCIEPARDGLVHLVFDMPDRSMNVFSNAAILELGTFAAWLKTSEVRGVVVRSGKTSAFCAGADLAELGVAYDMIVAAPEPERFRIAFDHFFALSQAIRALETSGKPVAAAIGGLALGGGCELALGAHYRVLAGGPRVALGLPESLVGLLPGAGGTQRLPRLIGIDAALPVLLDGARLSGQAAVDAGLVHALVEPGAETAEAERWLLSDAADPVQPWDRPDRPHRDPTAVSTRVGMAREAVLARTLGHEPAPLAILDCIEQGLPLEFDQALRAEMSIFSHLIQRREPRDMIQTLFVGKLDHDRTAKAGGLSEAVRDAIDRLGAATAAGIRSAPAALAAAGFGTVGQPPVQSAIAAGYWLDGDDGDPRRSQAREALASVVDLARRLAGPLTETDRRIVDYALVSSGAFPAYLGGPFRFAEGR